MGLLNGGAAGLFGELLGPLYSPARVRAYTVTNDTRGNPRREAVVRDCRAMVDRATERMAGTEGYTADDRAIYVLASTLAGELNSDAEIQLLEGPYAGQIFKLAAPIDRDPAAAYWLARGVQGRAP